MFEDSRSTCLRPCFTYFIHMEWQKHFRHHLNRAVFLTAISQIGKIVAFHSGPNFQMNPFERQGALDLKLLWASGGINNNVSGERLPKFEMMFYLFMQVFFSFWTWIFMTYWFSPRTRTRPMSYHTHSSPFVTPLIHTNTENTHTDNDTHRSASGSIPPCEFVVCISWFAFLLVLCYTMNANV